MKLSIVSTLYKTEEYIDEFYRRISSAAHDLVGEEYEIILVNDGSPDQSLQAAVELADKDSKVVVVDLSRNFGHHQAMMCGLGFAQGDKIFLIDSDLEEMPEWLDLFNQRMSEEKADVVFGVQESRRGGAIERLEGRMFYKIFRFLTKIPQPDNIVTARLMSKRYVDSLLLHKEKELNIGGLWVITGYHQVEQKVVKLSSSETTYSFSNKVSHLVNAITSFSSTPLVFTFYTGLGIFLFAGVFVANLIINYFFFSKPVDGYTSLIASIWLMSGLIILFIGVQGIYISKIFSEVKQRPTSIVKRVYRAKSVQNSVETA